eukprot:COSAG06_NODE_3816_length_4877_cov_4.725827_2_plen_179_part_00
MVPASVSNDSVSSGFVMVTTIVAAAVAAAAFVCFDEGPSTSHKITEVTTCVACDRIIPCELGTPGCSAGFRQNKDCRRGFSCDETGTGSGLGVLDEPEEVYDATAPEHANDDLMMFGLPFLPGFMFGCAYATAHLRTSRKKAGKVGVMFDGKPKQWLFPPENLILQPFIPESASATPA